MLAGGHDGSRAASRRLLSARRAGRKARKKAGSMWKLHSEGDLEEEIHEMARQIAVQTVEKHARAARGARSAAREGGQDGERSQSGMEGRSGSEAEASPLRMKRTLTEMRRESVERESVSEGVAFADGGDEAWSGAEEAEKLDADDVRGACPWAAGSHILCVGMLACPIRAAANYLPRCIPPQVPSSRHSSGPWRISPAFARHLPASVTRHGPAGVADESGQHEREARFRRSEARLQAKGWSHMETVITGVNIKEDGSVDEASIPVRG